MSRTNSFAALALLLAVPFALAGAQGGPLIRGRITATDNGEAVAGATIVVAGTRIGSVSAEDGRYGLRVRGPNDTLVINRIGFRERREVVGSRTTIDVTLERTATTLSNVVTVGYGTQKRSDITGSVVSVPTDRLEDKPNVSVAQALQGSLPGVAVVNSGAGAEPTLNITVRGQRSISASASPLVVVDGIPYNGPLGEINPGDVASIDVLKDASATAIYGARGANGVILVTTKKGATGKARVQYSGSAGTQEFVDLPRVMTAAEFITFKCERLRVRADQSCAETFTQTENDNIAQNIDTPWQTLGTRTGTQRQHDLSVSGGNEETKYLLGGSLLDVEGVAKNDRYVRTTFRANVDQQIRPWLTAGTSTQFARTDRSGLPISFTDAYYQNPLIKPFNTDGSILINPWPEQPINGANPLENLFVNDAAVNNRLFTSNYAQLTVPKIPGLSFRLNAGADLTNSNNGRYYGRNTGTGLRSAGTATTSNSTRNDWTVENLLRYAKSFGRHAIDATGLYSVQSSSLETRSRDAQGFPNDVLGYRSALATLNLTTASVVESKIVSQMARLNYGYDERYLATLTTRRDGYSGFGANNKYGVFPSLALAWNVSNEGFFPFKAQVDAFKIRYTTGRNGNQAINPYQTLSQLADRSYLSGDASAPGYIPSTLGNPDLKWETTASSNIGFDLSMFRGRINWTWERYEAKTRDLLLSRSISSVQGITRITQNIGRTSNWGWETNLSTVNVDKGGVRWTTDLNVSVNRNQIVDLYGDGKSDLANQWFIGMPIDVNFGYKFDGIWQLADTARIRTSAQPTAKPGDVRIVDANGDGKIDPTDRTIIGSLQPKYTGGLTNTVRWKGITASAFLQTVQGVTRVNVLRGTGQVNANVSRNMLYQQYWTPTNPINSYPANSQTSNPLGVDFYEDASFVRLKDVSLSYDLPKATFTRLGVQSARVYVNGRNLWTSTKWTGMDPELAGQRAVPLERTFTAGVNIRY
ncbi:SusC/RagA family TonB-linked outer membrane protein [Gemmatimonas sp.]|jgi:TonB-linked SusC/RagA family outer membrane protein|uniref:SusC/RagA family TonB-linked outer membrane protein n=1 Tax=Gemmatimonas sp. TaxID=1962908 RepID=UPI0037BEEA41